MVSRVVGCKAEGRAAGDHPYVDVRVVAVLTVPTKRNLIAIGRKARLGFTAKITCNGNRPKVEPHLG